MRHFQALARAAAYLLFAAAAVQATTFTYDATINLALAPCICSGGNVDASANVPPGLFVVGVGDQITGTITIANGPVHLSGPAGSYFDISLQFDGFDFFQTSTISEVTLGGLAGSLPNQLFTSVASSGTTVVSAFLLIIDGSPYDFSFSQFNYAVTVTSLTPPGTPAQVVQADSFGIVAGSISLRSAVPEPGTDGLLAVGCVGLLGILGRRRRAQRPLRNQ